MRGAVYQLAFSVFNIHISSLNYYYIKFLTLILEVTIPVAISLVRQDPIKMINNSLSRAY
jgi:hypothetical protein